MVRFVVVGLLAAIMNTAIIVAFTELLGIHYLISYVLCFLIVTGGAYLLNRGWTFSLGGNANSQEATRYYAISLLAVAIAIGLTWAMVEIGMAYYIAILITSAIMAPINFVLHRVVSFGIKEWGVNDVS